VSRMKCSGTSPPFELEVFNSNLSINTNIACAFSRRT